MPLDRNIDFNLETTSLQIKTDSALGSGHKMLLYFFTDQENGTELGKLIEDTFAGGLGLSFSSTPNYWLTRCTVSGNPVNFEADVVPAEVNKLWKITLTRTSSPKIVIHCNDVEVLNFELSDSSCRNVKDGTKTWSRYWNRKVGKIQFVPNKNTAPDFYLQPWPITVGKY